MDRKEVMVWTDRQRSAIWVLVGIFLVYLFIQSMRNRQFVSDPFEGEGARAGDLADRIDPNTADWAELAVLPQVGPALAKKIVEERKKFLAENPGKVAFERPEDLARVKGIGQVTAQAMEPYLLFSRSSPAPPDRP